MTRTMINIYGDTWYHCLEEIFAIVPMLWCSIQKDNYFSFGKKYLDPGIEWGGKPQCRRNIRRESHEMLSKTSQSLNR